MDYKIKNKIGVYKLISILPNGTYKLTGYLEGDTIKRKSTLCTEYLGFNGIKSDVDTVPIYLDGATIASGLNANGIGWKIKMENGICTEYQNGMKLTT